MMPPRWVWGCVVSGAMLVACSVWLSRIYFRSMKALPTYRPAVREEFEGMQEGRAAVGVLAVSKWSRPELRLRRTANATAFLTELCALRQQHLSGGSPGATVGSRLTQFIALTSPLVTLGNAGVEEDVCLPAARYKCPALLRRKVQGAHWPPPHLMPKAMQPAFTLQALVPVVQWYKANLQQVSGVTGGLCYQHPSAVV